MGYNPLPPPPPSHRVMSISEQEIASLKELYVEERLDLEEFEKRVGNWLMWETLGPLERREFELTQLIKPRPLPTYREL